MSPDLGVIATIGTSLVTVGFLYGVTKTQTAHIREMVNSLRESFRHHVETEHPTLAKEAREHEKDLAVLKHKDKEWRQSQIDRGEHLR